MRPREAAREALRLALQELDTCALTARFAGSLPPPGAPCHLVAVGKAASQMAEGVAAAWPISQGLVITKDGHVGKRRSEWVYLEAGHPWPDARSVHAADALRRCVIQANGPLVLALSGGASALVASPAWGLRLVDKVLTTRAVAGAGRSIRELNIVRKHLSSIKGGRLGALARSPIVSFVLSDVVGNDLSTVGSGLCWPDPSTFADALDVVSGVCVKWPVPECVRTVLEAGARGGLEETPKPGDPRLAGASSHIVAGPDDLAAAAARACSSLGFRAEEVVTGVACSALSLAESLVARAVALVGAGPRAFVAGGEPVVHVTGAGLGGRAQHTALLAAIELERALPGADVAILCAGSDGTDGPTDAAGGLVDPGTCARARAAGVDPAHAARTFDAATALAAAGDQVVTGPTGTNLCDLFLVLA